MRWIGGGLGCFSRYYKITHILSAHACIACIDMVYSKALERDVTTTAMVKATTAPENFGIYSVIIHGRFDFYV